MEVKEENTEDKIINATIHLLDETGLAGITTKKIAEEANISEVTIFRKFKSKQNLLKVAKQAYVQYFLEKLDDIFEYRDYVDLSVFLKSIWEDLLNLLDEDLNIIKISMEEVRDVPLEHRALLKISNKIISNLTYIFQNQIDLEKIRKINPEVAALNVFGVLFEAVLLWKIYGKKPNKDLDKYLDEFLDIFVNGITVKN